MYLLQNHARNFNQFSLFQTKNESLQEVTVSNFFGKTNPKSPFQHQNGIKKKPRENGSFKKR